MDEGEGVENASYQSGLGVTKVKLGERGSLWHPNSRILRNTSIGGVS